MSKVRRLPTLIDITTPEKQAVLALRSDLADPIEYRKSGLSLNHVIGCPLDCAYCVRHLFDNFQMREPHALLADADAVEYLVRHPYFVPDQTPLQIFNRATDPFLDAVKPHTFAVLEDLDSRGLNNHVLVITRYRVTSEDCIRLNALSSIKVTLLITYSGIDDQRIEPIPSDLAVQSLATAYEHANRYRVILYWRPIVPGLNDSDEHLKLARSLSLHAHATVFTGLFYRSQIRDYYRSIGLPEPYIDVARRKILPAATEDRIIEAFGNGQAGPLFRKTSCGVCYAHAVSDYNGHYGIREVCNICPTNQVARCADAHRVPGLDDVISLAMRVGELRVVEITPRSVVVDGFTEQQRYFMQHAFSFQFHDVAKPHHFRRHGRAESGWDHVDSDHS